MGIQSLPGSFSGNDVAGEVGAGEVGVAGKSGAWLPIDEKTDLGHGGQIGMESGANREHCEGLGFKPGGMAGGKGAGEVDDCQLASLVLRVGDRQQEDLGDGRRAAGHGVGGAGSGIQIEEPAQYGAGPRSRISRQGKSVNLGHQRIIHVVGGDESGLLGGGDDRCGSGRRRFSCEQSLVGPIAELPQLESHSQRSDEEDGEQNLLVARNHGWRASERLGSERHSRRAAARAVATFT